MHLKMEFGRSRVELREFETLYFEGHQNVWEPDQHQQASGFSLTRALRKIVVDSLKSLATTSTGKMGIDTTF